MFFLQQVTLSFQNEKKLKYLQYESMIKSSISAKGLLVRLYLFGKLYFFLTGAMLSELYFPLTSKI